MHQILKATLDEYELTATLRRPGSSDARKRAIDEGLDIADRASVPPDSTVLVVDEHSVYCARHMGSDCVSVLSAMSAVYEALITLRDAPASLCPMHVVNLTQGRGPHDAMSVEYRRTAYAMGGVSALVIYNTTLAAARKSLLQLLLTGRSHIDALGRNSMLLTGNIAVATHAAAIAGGSNARWASSSTETYITGAQTHRNNSILRMSGSEAAEAWFGPERKRYAELSRTAYTAMSALAVVAPIEQQELVFAMFSPRLDDLARSLAALSAYTSIDAMSDVLTTKMFPL